MRLTTSIDSFADTGYVAGLGNGYVLPITQDPNDLVTKSGAQTITGAKKFGTDTNNSTFEADGTYKANGSATTFEDINFSLVPATGGSATPATIAFNGDARLKCVAFSGTNPIPDEIPTSTEILHRYKEGSDIEIHIHMLTTTADVGDVKMQLRYAWYNMDSTPSAATTVAQTKTTPGVAWSPMNFEWVISGSGKQAQSRLVYSIFRDPTDAADTYTHAMAATDYGVHIEADTLGSRTIHAK